MWTKVPRPEYLLNRLSLRAAQKGTQSQADAESLSKSGSNSGPTLNKSDDDTAEAMWSVWTELVGVAGTV